MPLSITIYGNTNQLNTCSTTTNFGWKLTNLAADFKLRDTMVHELGHALNLGHPDDPTHSILGSGENSVMAYIGGLNSSTHLWPWEKECSEKKYGGRHVTGISRSFNSMGSFVEQEIFFNTGVYLYSTQKGSTYGAPWVDNGTAYTAYSVMNDTSANAFTAPIGSDGYLSWFPNNNNWSPNPMDVSPHFTNVNKGSDNQLVYYNWVSSKTTDPPQLKGLKSTNMFSTRTFSHIKDQNAPGSGFSYMYSHIPLSSTYDPASDQIIFASVNTTRSSTDEGGIKIHPGPFANWVGFVWRVHCVESDTSGLASIFVVVCQRYWPRGERATGCV